MDLSYTREQEDFRAQVRAWLREHVPSRPLPSAGTAEGFAAHRAWEQQLHAEGFAGIHWPASYGGRGADVVMQAIFEEEYFLAGGPERISVVGQKLMGPTLMVHGSQEQKARWLPGILDATTIWSQGFSEPEAGSDLAGLRTRAERDGDDWVLNGQKIWTSYGAFADLMFALVRTDPDAGRHAGITFIVVDMAAEGVDARPIVQLDGHAGFAEVFFTDVRVPASDVVGAPGDGWTIAMTTLGFERDSPASPPATYLRAVDELAGYARALHRDTDGAVRDAVGRLYARARAYEHQAMRTLTRLARGESLGPQASTTKLLWSHLEQDLYETARELLGPYSESLSGTGPVADPEGFSTRYWFARAATIYAGTTEIQRTIVAERILGLPRGS